MKKNIWILLFALIFTISCQNSNSENTSEHTNSTTEAAVDKKQEENSKDPHESKPNRQQETVSDKVADLLKEQAFFQDVKDAKSGTEEGVQIMVNSSYEYIEKDGKKVLDGQAYVDIIAMGYGAKTSANFKEGVLEGVAYEAVSVPSTSMLKLDYKDATIQKASIFTLDMGDCQGFDLPAEKTLAEMKAELENILKGKNTDKLQKVDCPTEINTLFN